MSEKQNTAPTILVVEPDDDVRPLLKNNLQRQGYCAIMTLDEEDAIARARGDRDQPDLILINQYRLPLRQGYKHSTAHPSSGWTPQRHADCRYG